MPRAMLQASSKQCAEQCTYVTDERTNEESGSADSHSADRTVRAHIGEINSSTPKPNQPGHIPTGAPHD